MSNDVSTECVTTLDTKGDELLIEASYAAECGIVNGQWVEYQVEWQGSVATHRQRAKLASSRAPFRRDPALAELYAAAEAATKEQES